MQNARYRNSILRYSRSLRARAKAFAGRPGANNDDKRILADNEKLLASSLKALVTIIDNHGALVLWEAKVSPDLRPEDLTALGALKPVVLNGLVDLSAALSAAMHIGGHCFDSPIYKQEEKNARAELMRNTRAKSKTQLLDDLYKFAKPVWEEHRDWKAPRIAAEIADAFNEGRKTPCKENTIERRVRELMGKNGHKPSRSIRRSG